MKSDRRNGLGARRLSPAFFHRWLPVIIILSILGLTASFLRSDPPVQAEPTQTLAIYKYGLSADATGFAPDQTIDTGEEINGIPLDNNGNELSPMAGVVYLVQSTEPDAAGNCVVGGTPLDSPQSMTTDAHGRAALDLTAGCYTVSEQANPALHLSNPAAPIVLRLDPNNTSRTISLYPKSSLDPVTSIDPAPTTDTDPPSTSNPSEPPSSDATNSGNSTSEADGPGTNAPDSGTLTSLLSKTGVNSEGLFFIALLILAVAFTLLHYRRRQ